jgi:hypothetical protein
MFGQFPNREFPRITNVDRSGKLVVQCAFNAKSTSSSYRQIESKGDAVTEFAPEKTGPMQAPSNGGRFQKGQSGNPAGKPRGTRSRVTVIAQQLMNDDLELIIKAVTEAAKAGDMTAAKIVLDRVAPIRKGSLVPFSLPEIRSAAGALEASNAVLSACANGEITPQEAADINNLIARHVKLIEVAELEKRVEQLEQQRQNEHQKSPQTSR